MDSITIFTTALQFEEKIRDLYREAETLIDDDRGRAIFSTLANEEQSHIDFLENSLEILKNDGEISAEQLTTAIPDAALIASQIDNMKTEIPERMLGDIKRILNSALKLEEQTTAFYRDAYNQTEGNIKDVLGKFVEIEQRHTDIVQIELDHATNSGHWFNFMEISMEEG